MKAKEIRSAFLRYFETQKKLPHKRIPSSQLIPANDTSVLFTIAGMQQLKPYFLGKAKQAVKDFESQRLVSVQKCFRVADIDDIGDETHLTFFEMLGNFSIGDYFKEEAIEFAWEFITKELRIPTNNLVVTYFQGDEENKLAEDVETKNIWTNKGLEKHRIIGTNKEETFWGPPGETGPCGPSTEIHYIKDPNAKDLLAPNNAIEIWNIVFMEFEKKSNGSYKELAQKNIDTGMGLERLAVITEKVENIFTTSVFTPLIDKVQKDPAFDNEPGDVERRLRIIVDHLRASAFLLADGVQFGKKEQQAVLRRIFRKALDNYRGLHADVKVFVSELVAMYGQTYPELVSAKDTIIESMLAEQEQYHAVRSRKVESFLPKLRKSSIVQSQQEKLAGPSHRLLTAEEAFHLNTTYGFSFEHLSAEGYTFDTDEVNKMISDHKEKSKEGAEQKFGGHGLDTVHEESVPEEERIAITRLHTATHLLHSALRKVLGDSVNQKGSDINAKRLRFDFEFPRKLTDEEKETIQELVNKAITSEHSVIKETMPLSNALAKGALAFFREKYPETVSVYSVVDEKTGTVFSMELCGGPHVKNTKEIGMFTITSEKSVAKGVRRIKAELS